MVQRAVGLTPGYAMWRVTFERCRSAKGVPYANFIMSYGIYEDAPMRPFIIEHALDSLVIAAKKAHPDNPDRWMPSEVATDYALGEPKYTRLSSIWPEWLAMAELLFLRGE